MVQIATAQPKDVQGEAPLIGFEGALAAQKVATSIGDAIHKVAQPLIKSQQNAEYSDAYSKMTVDTYNQVQERYLDQTDKDGKPTYGSLVGDVQNIIATNKNKYASQISDPEVSERFNLSVDNLTTQLSVEAGHTARTQQVNWIKSSLKNTLSQQSNQIGVAGSPQKRMNAVNQIDVAIKGAVQHGAITAPEGNQLKIAALQSGTKQTFLHQIDSNHPQDVLHALKDGGAKYGLDQTTVYSLQTKAYSRIAKQRAYLKGAWKSFLSTLNDHVATIKATQALGHKVSQQAIDGVTSLVKGTSYEAKYTADAELLKETNDFLAQSGEDQQKTLNHFGRPNAPVEDLKRYNLFSAINTTISNNLKKDGYKEMQNQGNMPQTDPMNWNDHPSNIAQNLHQRKINADRASHIAGKTILPINSDELQHLSTFLATSSPTNAMVMYTTLVKSLGSDSKNVFRALAKKGSGLMGFTGTLAANGNTAEATKILEGRELLKNSPGFFSDLKKYTPDLSDIPIYGNPKRLGQVDQAIKTIAATYMRNGTYDNTKIADAYEAAHDELFGSAIKYNGQLLERPDPAVDKGDFRDFMNSLSYDDIKDLGGVAGVKTKEDWDLVKNNLTLISLGDGQYDMKIPVKGSDIPIVAQDSKSENAFILDYNQVLKNRLASPTVFSQGITSHQIAKGAKKGISASEILSAQKASESGA